MKLPPWAYVIMLVTAVGALMFQCVTPLPAAAAVAALTLPRNQALVTAAGTWLLGQALGFAFMNYPVDVHSIGWGLAIGGATMLAALTATYLQQFRQHWAVSAGIPAFIVYEGALAIVALAFGGIETFAPNIVLAFATVNFIWLAAMAGLFLAMRTASRRITA